MQDLNKELKSKTFGYISAALGLVAGLAWNDAIKELIEVAFPLTKNTIGVKFLYAILVTIAVVILIKSINRMINNETDK